MFNNAISPTAWGSRVDYDTWSDLSSKDKWILHYGGPAVSGADDGEAREAAVLRAWEKFHIDSNGWRGIAYNYAIGNSGTLYRLRGENRGGHTKGDYEPDGVGENTEGRAVVFILGGDQKPSAAALATFMGMWREDPMMVIGHQDVFKHGTGGTSTACPGPHIMKFIEDKGYEGAMGLSDQGERKGVDSTFEADWAFAVSMGWASEHTDPDDVVTKEELFAFLRRLWADVETSAVDGVARETATKALNRANAARTVADRADGRLDAIKEAL